VQQITNTFRLHSDYIDPASGVTFCKFPQPLSRNTSSYPPLQPGKVILRNRPTPKVTSLLIQRRKMIKLNKEISDLLTRNVSNKHMTLIFTFFINILSLHALSTISLPHSKVINVAPQNCGLKYAYQ
jgi:hypothetical protein